MFYMQGYHDSKQGIPEHSEELVMPENKVQQNETMLDFQHTELS